MRVRNGKVSFAIDRHARRSAIVVYRGLQRANEFPVGIEDFNTRSHVDDVTPILFVDRQCARLLKTPVRDAQASPSSLSRADARLLFIATRQRGQRNTEQ